VSDALTSPSGHSSVFCNKGHMFRADNKSVRLNSKIIRIFKEEKIVINVSFFYIELTDACW
jgi:hypothetical protein